MKKRLKFQRESVLVFLTEQWCQAFIDFNCFLFAFLFISRRILYNASLFPGKTEWGN